MQYQVGETGKVVAMRLFEGEDIHETIEEVCKKEHIQSALVTIIGGLRKANIVVGPKEEEPKTIPDTRIYEGPGEIIGTGMVFPDTTGPKVHFHVGIGKAGETIIGCLRKESTVFLSLEVTIIELKGILGKREFDKEKGVHNLLVL